MYKGKQVEYKCTKNIVKYYNLQLVFLCVDHTSDKIVSFGIVQWVLDT